MAVVLPSGFLSALHLRACGQGVPALSKCAFCDRAPAFFILPNGMTWAGQFLQMAAAALLRPWRAAQVAGLSLAFSRPFKQSQHEPYTNAHRVARVALVVHGTAVGIGKALECLGNGLYCLVTSQDAR